MNINVRIRRYHQRQKKPAAIPAWADLQKLDEAGVKALAERLGIEYTERMATLSAIHNARG